MNKLIKRTKIQYYRHKLEYVDNKDMINILNSLTNQRPRAYLILCVLKTVAINSEFFQLKKFKD